MPPPCRVCGHPQRKQIEDELIRCTPERKIAAQFGLGRTSISNHARSHCDAREIRAKRKRAARIVAAERRGFKPATVTIDGAADVLECSKRLLGEVLGVASHAKELHDDRLALQAAKQATDLLTQIGRAHGLFREESLVVNIDASAKALKIIGEMPEPELRAALLALSKETNG